MTRLALLLLPLLLSCDARDEVLNAIQTTVIVHGAGQCSGVYVGPHMVLTNAHCVTIAVPHKVTTVSGGEFEAAVYSVSTKYDLALLRTDEEGTSIRISTVRPTIGSRVYAIGAPRGLGWTLSRGVVSYVGRVIPALNGGQPLLQIDAMIQAGSSGGAVVNSEGELVGISTGCAAFWGPCEGINFAVPADQIMEFLREQHGPKSDPDNLGKS